MADESNIARPPQRREVKDTKPDLLDAMQEFIACVQHVDKTTTDSPRAEKALVLFRLLVEGVK